MSASNVAKAPDFSSITELPRQGATPMQMSMLRTRYGWAAQHTAGKDVLEVACGAGLGLGWLAERARRVAAGDVDEKNCRIAREAHRGQANIRVQWMDALALPFAAGSFDVALLFEAQYYLPDLPRFLTEAQRVLRPGGALLISTANCEWSGFHPSFLHTRYWTAVELLQALDDAEFKTRLCAGFPEHDRGGRGVRKLKAVASRLGCIPRSTRKGGIETHFPRAAGLYSRALGLGGASRADDSGRHRDRSYELPNAVFRSAELPMTPARARAIPFFSYPQAFLREEEDLVGRLSGLEPDFDIRIEFPECAREKNCVKN